MTSYSGRGRIAAVLAALAAGSSILAGPVAAQSGPPNALQGFSQNRNEPIKIEALTLEVRDKEKTATFIDNVRVTQGDTTLESRRLTVYYDGDAAAGAKGGALAKGGAKNQQIRRLEAKGGVVVTQGGQTAVGDEGVYDVSTNSMVLLGNVVVTQGQNVIRGHRLWVDLATGRSRVEAQTGGSGRVQGVFLPGSAPPGGLPQPGSRSQPGAPPSITPPGASERDPPARSSRASDRQPGSPAPAKPPRRLN